MFDQLPSYEDIDISKFIEEHKKKTYEELKNDPEFIKWKEETDKEISKGINVHNGGGVLGSIGKIVRDFFNNQRKVQLYKKALKQLYIKEDESLSEIMRIRKIDILKYHPESFERFILNEDYSEEAIRRKKAELGL